MQAVSTACNLKGRVNEMKQMKRIVSLLLTLIMVLGLFTGCKKEEAKVAKGDGKITVGLKQDTTIPDYDTNALTKYLEEVTGLEIKWEYFSSNEDNAKRQITLMCSGGEKLPDVFLGIQMGHYMVNQFGEDGYFIDLTELMEDYAPNYQKAMSQLSKEQQKYVKEKLVNTVDGNIYAMPTYSAFTTVDDQQSMMYINKKWLDAVGMGIPKTIQELEAVLTAFATKDPNGNGKADELPMLAQQAGRNWIMNAFVEYDETTFNVKDGKVWDPVYTEEFRKGVQYINGLVSKDLCHEYGFTLSTQEIKNLISPTDGSPVQVGIFAGHFESMTNPASNALDEFVSLGALEDASGKGLGGYNIINNPQVSFDAVITSDCKDPEEAMKFLDALYGDECVIRQRYGEKDVHWEYSEGVAADGKSKSYIKVLDTNAFFDGSMNATLHNLLGIRTFANYLPIVEQDGNYVAGNRISQVNRIMKDSFNTLYNSGKRTEYNLDGMIYTNEEYDSREAKAGKSNAYMMEKTTLFMQCLKDPYNDNEWNEFLTELTSTGRKELMKIAQSAYDRANK